MTINERIKYLIEKSPYSRTDIADFINVSKQTLYKYENGIVTNIPSDKIENMSKIFNCSPAYIMGWDEKAINAISSAHDESMEDLASLDAEIALDKEERNMIQENHKAIVDAMGDEIFNDEEIHDIVRFINFIKNSRKDE